MEIDLLRITFVFFAGYFLSISGSLSQLITNNPIASPSTLGMDGVAVLAIILSQFIFHFFSMNSGFEYLSFIIFISIFSLTYLLAKLKTKGTKEIWDKTEIKKIIILGLSFNLFIGAIFSVIQFMFMSLNFDFPSGIWFGNFKQFSSTWLWGYGAIFLLTFVIINRLSSQLVMLNLGRNFAEGRNINVSKLQNLCLTLSLLLTGIVICFFGVFSFLSLIFPHIIRSISKMKSNMELELKYGALLSGFVLCLIDLFCYNFTFYGAELPVGMTSSVIGAFFLIILVLRQKV